MITLTHDRRSLLSPKWMTILTSAWLLWMVADIKAYKHDYPSLVSIFDEQECQEERQGLYRQVDQGLESEADIGALTGFVNEGMKKRNHLATAHADYDALMTLTGQRYSAGGSVPHQRSIYQDRPPPGCSCPSQPLTLDLGSTRFPRYISSLICTNTISCWTPDFSCKPKYLKVAVLKVKEPGDVADRHAPMLPEPLRGSYKFENINTVVGCECSL